MVLAMGLACGEPAPATVAVVQGPAPPGVWAHALGFEGGAQVHDIVTPERIEPGSSFSVSWQAPGAAGLRARVGAWPPRPGSRQVALGGVGAPAVQGPADDRVRFVELTLSESPTTVELTLPAPWHPRQVLLTLELLDGDTRVPAIDGPRRNDGIAQLALVDVVPRPVEVVAAPMIAPPTLDGRLDDSGWASAIAYPMVHSLHGEPYRARPGTVRWAWDTQALYVAAEIEDPDVWSDYRAHDDPLWNQEVFEVFVFGDDRRREYLELQVSPRGVTFDARFDRYRKGEPGWNGTWRSAVDLRGSTLDDRGDRDRGWSVELSIPWAEICAHTEVVCPVTEGTTLRINAFRFERPAKGSAVGLAVSPPLVADFHAPENSAVLELGGS